MRSADTMVAREIRRLALAVGFLTRLPLPARLFRDAEDLAAASHWFGAAGLLVGMAAAAVWATTSIVLPPFAAAGCALAAGLLLTGALHEDGLADTADGLGGGRDRERALAIMRDSAIGTYGTLALILSVGLRWAALAAMPVDVGVLALLVSHSVARQSIVLALASSPYARNRGAGETVSRGVGARAWAGSAAIWLLLVPALLAGGAGLLTALGAQLAAALFSLHVARRLGGYTGDTLGAMEQIGEVTCLLALLALWTSS